MKYFFKSTSTKNTAGEQSASTTPVLTDAIKKRTERFGDVSQVAKANTSNVNALCFDHEILLFLFRNKKPNVQNDSNQLQVFNR